MTYRVICNLDITFQSGAEARKLFKAIKQTIGEAHGLDNKMEMNSVHLEVHKCYHGDLKSRPCEIIEMVESLSVSEATE